MAESDDELSTLVLFLFCIVLEDASTKPIIGGSSELVLFDVQRIVYKYLPFAANIGELVIVTTGVVGINEAYVGGRIDGSFSPCIR